MGNEVVTAESCEGCDRPEDDCDCLPTPAVPCERCGTRTIAEAPYGALCHKCCFADNH